MSRAVAPSANLDAVPWEQLTPAQQWEFEQVWALTKQAATDAYNTAQLSQARDLAQGKIDSDTALKNAELAASHAAQEVQMAFDTQKTNADNRLKVLDLVSKLTGPRNAFIQQAVVNGLNKAGLSNAVDWISGKVAGPRTQGSQATPQPLTLDSFLADNGLTLPGEIKPPTLAPFQPIVAPRLPPAAVVAPAAAPAAPSNGGIGSVQAKPYTGANPGQQQSGYTYIGGDAANPASWRNNMTGKLQSEEQAASPTGPAASTPSAPPPAGQDGSTESGAPPFVQQTRPIPPGSEAPEPISNTTPTWQQTRPIDEGTSDGGDTGADSEPASPNPVLAAHPGLFEAGPNLGDIGGNAGGGSDGGSGNDNGDDE